MARDGSALLTIQVLSPYAGRGNASQENRGASGSDRAARRRRDRRTDRRQPGRQLRPSHDSVIDIAIVRESAPPAVGVAANCAPTEPEHCSVAEALGSLKAPLR